LCVLQNDVEALQVMHHERSKELSVAYAALSAAPVSEQPQKASTVQPDSERDASIKDISAQIINLLEGEYKYELCKTVAPLVRALTTAWLANKSQVTLEVDPTVVNPMSKWPFKRAEGKPEQQACGNTPYDEGPFAIEQPNLIDFHNGAAAMWSEDGKVKAEWHGKAEQQAEPVAWLFADGEVLLSADMARPHNRRHRTSEGKPLYTRPPAQAMRLSDAVANLIKVKGRHHTEQAFQRLVSAYDALLAAQGGGK
jgi:hypothetical protein